MTRIFIVVFGLAIVWLALGRRITLLLDRMTPFATTSLPTSPLRYDGGSFVIGSQSLTFGGTNNLRFDLTLTTDANRRVILTTGQHAFPLGIATKIDIEPEPGDQRSLTTTTSLLPWPTPFEFKILGGASPWWKRYVYYRLVIKKPSGAALEMVWRYEQQYFSAKGWTEPFMLWMGNTGLLSVTQTS